MGRVDSPLNLFGDARLRRVYEGRVRAGGPGQLSIGEYTIWQAEASKLAFIDPAPRIDYSSPEYRTGVTGSSDVVDSLAEQDDIQVSHLKIILPFVQRGMTVVDCGCAGGSLLDWLGGVARRTVAVEPLDGYHESLTARGHLTFSRVRDALDAGHRGDADLVVAFHVIEHVDDPIGLLREIRQLLKPAGLAYIHTPNLDEILMKLIPDTFGPFYFREAHNFYFTAESLARVAEAAGFDVQQTVYLHRYGMANMLHWLRDRYPRSDEPIEAIGQLPDGQWKDYLERTGQASDVGVILAKSKDDPGLVPRR